jgi:uncharacterized ion transporter superfamily protein YfcC
MKRKVNYMQTNDVIKIGKKSFIFSFCVLLVLIIISGTLTYALDAGSYDYTLIDGRDSLIQGTYHLTDTPPLPVFRWFTAPFETLAGPDSLTIIVIILFLLFLGGSFAIITSTGALSFAVAKLCEKFINRKYLLLTLTSLFFMLLGTAVGIFEESVLLAPIAVSLAVALGFDVFTGLFISVLSTGFGFAAGVFNPFTTGVAQTLAGVKVFSGAGYRLLGFIVVFLLLNAFIQIYSRKVYVKKQIAAFNSDISDSQNQKRGVTAFVAMLTVMLIWVILSTMIDGLSDYTMPALALIFLLGGIITGYVAGKTTKMVFKTLLAGMIALLPGVVLILMASSVKYIMHTGGILDTLLYTAGRLMQGMGAYSSVLAIYMLVLVLNFFIGSGSAKAFLVIPIVAPLASMSGVGAQTAILAFLFGDGFSNTFYITNAVLLVTLGITGVSYADWFKKTWVLQLLTLIVTSGLLLLAVVLNY